MKIALICTEMLPVPAIRGGAIQILITGVAPILSQKHEVSIFSITDQDLPNYEKKDGIEYLRFHQRYYMSGVARILRRRRYDVIHVFNRPRNIPYYKAFTPYSKFVLSLHNELFAQRKISNVFGSKIINSVSKIITVSDYIGTTVTRRFPYAKYKVKTVYSGVNLKKFLPIWSPKAEVKRNKLRKKYGLDGKKVILFIGRVRPKKGPDRIIKAMEHVIKKQKDAVLVISGGRWFSDNTVDEYIRYLHKLAKPLGDHVVFTKFIPVKSVPNHYLIGDVFVVSSQWQEPLARVHYEAMAAGLPIITTNRGGNPEIIKDKENGLVIKDYKNPKAFADAISYLLSKPDEAVKMAKKGRKLVEGNFDFTHVAHRLEKTYIEAKNSKP